MGDEIYQRQHKPKREELSVCMYIYVHTYIMYIYIYARKILKGKMG